MPEKVLHESVYQRLSKEEKITLRANAIELAGRVGQRAAARELGLSEDTVTGWVGKAKRRLRALGYDVPREPSRQSRRDPNAPDSSDVLKEMLILKSDQTKLGLASASVIAANHYATLPAGTWTDMRQANAMDAVTRTADRVHGWSIERTQAPVVQVAVINQPTPEQEQQRAAADKRLDELTRLLQAKSTP